MGVYFFQQGSVKARQAKSQLVKAFSCARDAITQRQTQYLPMLHTAHDSIQSIACRARANGSTTPEHIFHMSYEKLINKVIGIDAGARDRLNLAQQCAFTAAYATIYNIAQRGLGSSPNFAVNFLSFNEQTRVKKSSR